MKKLTVVVCVSFVLFISACSGDKTTETPQQSTAKTAEAPSRPAANVSESKGVSPVPKAESTAPSGVCQAIVIADCESCHSESRMCQKIGRKNERRWNNTIDRMIKRGSKISPSDKKTLVDCLVNESPDIVNMCK